MSTESAQGVKKLRPQGDKILVKRDNATEKTAGGIIIPDTAKEKLTRGTVLAVGTGKLRDDGSRTEIPLRAGEKVIFGKYSGNEFEFEGETDLIFMREDEIYAAVEE